MKLLKKLILFILMGASLSSFGQNQSFTLNGKINVNSGIIYLKSFRNKMFFPQDSAKILNGQFQFKGTVKRPDVYGLTIKREESFSPYYIFLENSTIRIEIDTTNHRSAKIQGSKANDLFVSFQSKRRGFNLDSFIIANPSSSVPAYVLYREYATRLTANQIESKLALFSPSLYDLSYIKELKEIIETKRKVEIGVQSIDFSGITPQGKTIKLSDYKGKYVLLDFWASWCGPCRRENPNLVKTFSRFKAKGFDIFGVSLDHSKEGWLKAIEKDQLTWNHVSDLKFWDSKAALIYGIRNIPSNVLIDPSGKIIARDLRGEELNQKLEEIFK